MLAPDPEAEAIADIVRQWVLKAEEDLAAAEVLYSKAHETVLTATCFHAQQCVEKYVKALLVLYQIEFARTHNLALLLPLLPPHLRPEITEAEQGKLNDYAVNMRYPGDFEPVSHEDATSIIKLAKRVRTQVREHLPKATL